MAYTVTSHNLSIAACGDTVTEDQLVGCNVDALIAGGHLVPQTTNSDETSAETKEN